MLPGQHLSFLTWCNNITKIKTEIKSDKNDIDIFVSTFFFFLQKTVKLIKL